MITRILKRIINKAGYDLKRIKSQSQLNQTSFTMEGGLFRCKQRGIVVNSVFDVGASDGRWSEICMRQYPEATYQLIEAQKPHEPKLEAFKALHPNADFILAAASNTSGEVYFDDSDLMSGLASNEPIGAASKKLKAVAIDDLVRDRNLKPPYLVKLDTHGFEIPILEGARETLKQANLVIIETYNFKLRPGAPMYHEMVAYMASIGFSSIEVVDLMQRKRDGALWQMDTFFIPTTREEFKVVSFT
jgi:FkbM family methyltransferase